MKTLKLIPAYGVMALMAVFVPWLIADVAGQAISGDIRARLASGIFAILFGVGAFYFAVLALLSHKAEKAAEAKQLYVIGDLEIDSDVVSFRDGL